MPFNPDDTIAALASPPGPALRGIIRVSGLKVRETIKEIFRQQEPQSTPAAEQVVASATPTLPVTETVSESWTSSRLPQRYSGTLHVPSLGLPLPAALMFWPSSRSFTGEPMAELHLIGAPPLLDAVLERLFECGSRPAGRGEFTMRAFLSGRIDLLQAEAVLGVIDAADHDELQQALSQLGGGLTSSMGKIRADLVALLGDLEAGLDFVEEDIQFISRDSVMQRLTESAEFLQHLVDDSQTKLPSGWRRRVVLAGLPNAGKSTLFNRLAGQQKAIVSPVPGTTRDYLSAIIRIGGFETELIDTAGFEDAADLIMEQANQARDKQLTGSDLILWCSAANLNPDTAFEDNELRRRIPVAGCRMLHVLTQCDLTNTSPPDASTAEYNAGTTDDVSVHLEARKPDQSAAGPVLTSHYSTTQAIRVSVLTEQGIAQLYQAIAESLTADCSSRGELISSTAARCRDSLRRSIAAVHGAMDAAQRNLGDELISLEIRAALHELGTVLGEVYTDDILDHIFSSFCIGK